jgi:spore maturation protein SpmB
MVELSKLNPHPGSASNAMVLFLAINTSAITVLPPGGTVGVRLAAGSEAPMAIWIPTLIATTCSTAAAIAMYYLLRRLPIFRHRDLPDAPDAASEPEPELPDIELPSFEAGPREPMGWWRGGLIAVVAAGLAFALAREAARLFGELSAADAFARLAQDWAFLLLVVGLLLVGVARRVPVYESMVSGAREGLDVAVRIVPYLVAMLTAVAMFKASGAMDDIIIPLLRPFTDAIGVPAEVMPMALLRPLSGSGAFAIMSETLTTHGPDGFIGMLTSTLQGSTETTFYVLALYLGAARIRDGRHTLAACLTGDVAGFFGAVVACHWFFG